MASIDSVQNPGISLEVDRKFLAARVALRPLDYTAIGKNLGHYKAFGQTTAAVQNAASILGALRWPDTDKLCVITRVYACITVVTAVTAQRTDPLLAYITRGYTVNDATAATALTITGNNGKMRSEMGSSLLNQGNTPTFNLAVTSAAAGMSGGTGTDDSNPFGAAAFGAGPALAALGTGLAVTELYRHDRLSDHPPVLIGNEGIRVRWGTTTLATGTIVCGIGFEWAEVVVY